MLGPKQLLRVNGGTIVLTLKLHREREPHPDKALIMFFVLDSIANSDKIGENPTEQNFSCRIMEIEPILSLKINGINIS